MEFFRFNEIDLCKTCNVYRACIGAGIVKDCPLHQECSEEQMQVEDMCLGESPEGWCARA